MLYELCLRQAGVTFPTHPPLGKVKQVWERIGWWCECRILGVGLWVLRGAWGALGEIVVAARRESQRPGKAKKKQGWGGAVLASWTHHMNGDTSNRWEGPRNG